MSLGRKLKNLRIRTRNTLREQSEMWGVSLNSIYRWEHNLAVPRKAMLEKIADHYNVSLESLLSELADSDYQKEEAHPTSRVEHQLLNLFRRMPVGERYKLLGYLERINADSMNEIHVGIAPTNMNS